MLLSDIPNDPIEENNHIDVVDCAQATNIITNSTSSKEMLYPSLLRDHGDVKKITPIAPNRPTDNMTSEDDIVKLVEALRGGALEQLRLAERLSVQLALYGAARRPNQTVTAAQTPPSAPAMGEHVISKALGGDELTYVSRTNFGTTKKLTLEYLQLIAPRVAGPTEIIKNTKQRTGTSLTFATVGRAIEQLIDEKLVEKTDRSRWRATSKLR